MAVAVRNGTTRGQVAGAAPEQEFVRTTETQRSGPQVTTWSEPPVRYAADGSILLNLKSMRVGAMYPVKLDGVQMVAIKERNESVKFYGLPTLRGWLRRRRAVRPSVPH